MTDTSAAPRPRSNSRYAIGAISAGAGRMYRVALAQTGETVGSTDSGRGPGGTHRWETGVGVLPEFQGGASPRRAAREIVQAARTAGRHRYLHAFPDVGNDASNAVCRRVGFDLLGPVRGRVPEGPLDHVQRLADRSRPPLKPPHVERRDGQKPSVGAPPRRSPPPRSHEAACPAPWHTR
ncbi:N-acetyltransferase [Streptomyces sp. T1317-0309]|nr:N-acetyltransferase [Streptomyces sp. T1317-0309]